MRNAHQNHKTIARLIAHVCDKNEKYPEHLQFFMVSQLLWAATSFDDSGHNIKYFGQRYWSRGALTLVNHRIRQGARELVKGLRHEHAVPKVCLEDELDTMYRKNSLTTEAVCGLLRFCLAVVVTKEEHAALNVRHAMRMPDGFRFDDEANLLARYNAANIEVFELEPGVSRNMAQGKLPADGLRGLLANKTDALTPR